MGADERRASDAERRVIEALHAVAAGEAEAQDVASELRADRTTSQACRIRPG